MGGQNEGTQQQPEEQEKPEEGTQQQEPETKPKTYTDKDVDGIVQKRLARERSKIEAEVRAEAAKQAEDKRTEAEKLAGMNDLQRAQYELKKANDEKAELERRINLSEQMGVARSELSGAGISLDDELLSMFVSEEAEKTNAAITKIKELWPKAVNAAVQEALKREVPPAGAQQPQKSYGATFAAEYSKRMSGGKNGA